MNRNVLILGGSSLLAINWAVANRDTFDIFIGINRRQIDINGVKSISIDMESVDEIKKIINKINPLFIVNSIGLTNIETCESNPKLAELTNVKIVSNIAEATNYSNKQLIHISSDHLFQGNQSFLSEDAKAHPLNTYAKTKVEAEKIVLNKNSHNLIIRTNFYGWGSSYRKSFSDFVIQNLRENQRVYLFKDIYYSPILIKRLVAFIIELFNKNAIGIFNIVSDDRISKYEFGLMVASEFNLNKELIIPILFSDNLNLVERPRDMSLSNKKISKFINCKIGSVADDLKRLKAEEENGIAQELKVL